MECAMSKGGRLLHTDLITISYRGQWEFLQGIVDLVVLPWWDAAWLVCILADLLLVAVGAVHCHHILRVLSQDGFYPVLPSQWEKSHKNHMVWYKRHISELRGIKKVVSAGTFGHNAPVMSWVGKVGVKVASYVSWQIGFAVTAREMWWLYDLLIVGGWELNGFLNAELWSGPLVQHREHNLHCPRRILGLPFLTAGETQQASEAVIQQH